MDELTFSTYGAFRLLFGDQSLLSHTPGQALQSWVEVGLQKSKSIGSGGSVVLLVTVTSHLNL